MDFAIGVSIAFVVSIWVLIDARHRGASMGVALLWWFGVFMLLIVFLPLYLIARPKKQPKRPDTSTVFD
jgi:uncharacterized membrane protein